MLIERNQMKRKKDYDAADQQREDLRRMGVQVDDKTKRWWPSGAPRGRSRSPPRGGGGVGGSSGYRRGDNGSTDVDAKKVEAMLIARLQMKMRRDYDAADQQREEFTSLGVQVNDKDKIWWAGRGGNHGGGSATYRRADDGSVEVDVKKIEEMLRERHDARQRKDFNAADRIQTAMRAMGVDMKDINRTWFVMASGGAPRDRSRSRSPQSRRGSPPRRRGGGGSSGYERGDNGSTDVDAKKVEAMLITRLQMKMRRDYDAADQQREEFKKMGVQVNDKRKTWWAGGGGGGVGSSSGPRPLLTRDRSEQDVRGRSPKRQRGSGSPDRSNGSSGNRGDGSRGSDEGGGGAGDDGSKGEEDVEKKKKPPPPPPRSKDVAASKSRSKSPGTPGSESA